MFGDESHGRLVQRTTSRRVRRHKQESFSPSTATLFPSVEGHETPLKETGKECMQRRMPSLDKMNMIDASVLRRSRLYSETPNIHDDSTKREIEQRINKNLKSLHPCNSDIMGTSTKYEVKGKMEVDSSMGDTQPTRGYEYTNHTADIQIHAWGASLSEALSGVVQSMIGYMVKLDNVEIDNHEYKRVSAQGHDVKSMVYNFLNEWLFVFLDCGFIPKKVEILSVQDFSVHSYGMGELLDPRKHVQEGTEIKAITYSNMQVLEENNKWHILTILDV